MEAFYYFTNDKYACKIVILFFPHEKFTKICVKGKGRRGNGACYLRDQVLREAQKISGRLPLISEEMPRFHGGSLWHVSPVPGFSGGSEYSLTPDSFFVCS